MAERKWLSLVEGVDSAGAEKDIQYQYSESDGRTLCVATIHYKCNGIWEIKDPFGQNDFSSFELDGAGMTTDAGAPMLCKESIHAVVPDGMKLSGWHMAEVTVQELPDKYDILPVPEDVLEEEELIFQKNDEYYGAQQYPAEHAEIVGEKNLFGINVILLFVYPLHYVPFERTVSVVTDAKIVLEFEQDTNGGDEIEGSSNRLTNSSMKSLFLGLEENNVLDDERKKKRLMIITTDVLTYSLEIYAAVKKFTYNVDMVKVGDIYIKYPDMDQDAAIRQYLLDEHKSSPISYVVFGGNVDLIPTHKASGGFASDSYYCMNEKGNGMLFSLSRFPAGNRKEMNAQTDIAAYYNRFYDVNIRKKAVFITYNRDDYKQCKDAIAASNATSDFTVKKYYDGGCTKKEMLNAIAAGVGFINYRGHGSNTTWSAFGNVTTSDIGRIDVEQNTPIVLSIACNNCNLNVRECFGAYWIRKSKAVAFLGATNPSYTVVNHSFDKYLWDAVYTQKLTTIGDILLWATQKLISDNPKSAYVKKNVEEYLILGDVSADYMQQNTTYGKG